jgi:hypothetical protein
MPNIHSANPPGPTIKAPMCPDCLKSMRFESSQPDTHYTNLNHMMYRCECGRASDQMIAKD